MAGPVKGNIGQEEIVLNDAATETTLLKLLAAMEKGGSGGGGGASEAQKNLVAMAQQTGKTTKELEEFEESVEDASTRLSRGFGHITASISGLANEFMAGSMRMSDFSSHITGAISNIPLIGGALGGTMQLLVSVVDQSVDTFRELSGVGVDLGADLMQARRTAAEAGLSLATFNDVIQNNSQSLALLGGNATAGAQRFASVSKEVQKNQMAFSRLGITMEETAAYTAEYMEQQTRLGRGQRMSDAQLAQGTQNYIKQLDYLSRVTGEQRDEIAKTIKENRNDNRLKLIFENMDAGTASVVDNVLMMTKSLGPDAQDAIKEMIATGGAPVSEYSKKMVAMLGPEIADAARLVKEGKMTEEQFVGILNEAGKKAQHISETQGDVLSAGAALGDTTSKVIGDFLPAAELGTKAADAAAAQAQAIEENSKSVANFEKSMQDARNGIMATLIDSGVFKIVQDTMSSFANFLDNGGTTKIKEAIQPFVDWIGGFMKDLQGDKPIGDVIKQYLSDGLSKLGEYIKPMLASAFSGLGSTIMGAIFGGGSSDSATPEAGAEGGESATKGAGSGGIFVGLDGALEKLATMVAVGGVVYAAIKGFQLLLGGFGSPAVMLGVGTLTTLLIGTGGAIALAGAGIQSAGEGVQKMADGLNSMSEIKDAAKLKDIAGALGDMGTAMLSLGAGNVLDSITSFFGASSPFEKMVEGINEFTGVDPAALTSMTSSAGALDSLKTFAEDIDSSKVTDFAESIKKLAEAMEKLNEEYADTRGFFGGGGPGSQEILNAIASGTSQGSAGVNSSVGELVALMKENNRISRQILAATGDGV